MLKNNSYSKKNSGFTLIEVLIAMFVLSVGMLGSTALMLQGRAEAVKVNYEAKAMQLALGMAEQMRANIAGVTNLDYDDIDAATATTDPGCLTTALIGCSTSEMAEYDAYIWSDALTDNLPSGTGLVSGSGADSIFTITVSWTETKKTSANTGVEQTKSVVMKFQP